MKINTQFKRSIISFIFAFVLIFSSFAKDVTYVVGQMYSIPSVEIGATQELVGNSAVMIMLDSWAKQAKGDLELFKKIVGGQSSVPAILAPPLNSKSARTSQFVITDGHHRASAINRLVYGDYSALPESVKTLLKTPTNQMALRNDPSLFVKLNLTAIYKTKEETAIGLAKTGKGLLSSETIESTPGFKKAREMVQKGLAQPADVNVLIQGYEHLPDSLSQLKDSPLRSAVGNAFYRAGINADYFNDYIEFYVGDYLQKKGLIYSLKDPLSEATTQNLFRDIFQDDDVIKYLQGQLRPGSESKGMEGLISAQKKTKQYLIDAKKMSLGKSEASCVMNLLALIAK